MKAVILAGGLGSRLRPFTETIPKPLLPIGEKAILEIQIERLKSFGFDEIFKKYDLTSAHKFETEWYYNIGNWEGYRAFLGSENFIKKPADVLTRPHIHGKISYNHQEGENT